MKNINSGNLKKTNNKRNLRDIDVLTSDVQSIWGRTFVYVRKTRIRTWKGVFILAFCAGAAAAIIWTVTLDYETKSEAAEGSELILYTDDTNVTLESGSNLVNIDVLLDSHENDVVAVKAVVKYDRDKFQLESWDTANSVFRADNPCSYSGGPCQIINDDPENGRITITMAKPSPGINTDSGIVAQLVFRAISITSGGSNFSIDYATSGSYDDSDVIIDNGNGSDILSVTSGTSVNVFAANCSAINYSGWGECQPDGMQYRTVTSTVPSGCYAETLDESQECDYQPSGGECTSVEYSTWGTCQPNGFQSRTVTQRVPDDCEVDSSELQQACVYTPPVCQSVTYSEWSACQVGGTQTRQVESRSPEDCVPDEDELTRSCDFVPPACTSYTYSSWTACQPDETQSRQVLSSLPAGCNEDAASSVEPDTQQDCEYSQGPTTCESFTYTEWGACQSGDHQYREVASQSPEGCSGGNPQIERDCTFVTQSCSQFTYSEWGSCQSNGRQTRTALSSSPAGCQGGNPELTRTCGTSNNVKKDDDDDDEKKEKKDKKDPKFTDLPYYLTKNRGDKVWWKAKDNRGVKYYTYNFNGKKVKTKKRHFFIPTDIRPGVYMLRVKAFDAAGNSKSRLVTIRVK